jgi:hypothetical protein
MRIKYKCSSFVIGMLSMSILLFLIGCGMVDNMVDNLGIPTSGPTQAQADAIAGQIANAAKYGMSHMSAEVSGAQDLQNKSLDCELWDPKSSLVPEKQVPQDRTVESTQGVSTQGVSGAACDNVPINISANTRTNCTAGGYITVVGGMTGTVSTCGNAYISIQLTESIVNWQCIGGWIVNGAPDISLVATFTFLNGAPATRQDMTISGAFSWTGTDSGSCQVDLHTNFDINGGSSTTTGTVCGHPISISTS